MHICESFGRRGRMNHCTSYTTPSHSFDLLAEIIGIGILVSSKSRFHLHMYVYRMSLTAEKVLLS